MKSDFVIVQPGTLSNITEVPHPDGQGLVGLQNPDGTYKSLTPNMTWQVNQPTMGSWERFYPYGGGYYAYREDSGKLGYFIRIPPIPYMP